MLPFQTLKKSAEHNTICLLPGCPFGTTYSGQEAGHWDHYAGKQWEAIKSRTWSGKLTWDSSDPHCFYQIPSKCSRFGPGSLASVLQPQYPCRIRMHGGQKAIKQATANSPRAKTSHTQTCRYALIHPHRLSPISCIAESPAVLRV